MGKAKNGLAAMRVGGEGCGNGIIRRMGRGEGISAAVK